MPDQKYLLITVRADYGGGPEHILSLLRGLSKRRCFVVAAPSDQAYSLRFAEHAQMQALPFRRFSVKAFYRLARLIQKEDIGLIHSHGKGAGIYARLLGWATKRPVVHTFHGFHYRHLSPPKRLLYLALERWLTKRTAALLNVSASERDTCVQAGVIDRDGSVVIPNGVSVPPLQHDRAAKPAGGKLILINVARHEPEKGVDGVLRIAERLSAMGLAYELWLVGDGEQGAALREQACIAGLEESVKFLGFRDDVAQLLQSAHIFVSASHGEGMPLTLLEAMAAGLPVVASDVVGNQDVVECGQTGFLFSLAEPQEGALAVARLMYDSELYRSCSRESYRQACERYSAEVMCERIDAVYQQVTAKTRMDKR